MLQLTTLIQLPHRARRPTRACLLPSSIHDPSVSHLMIRKGDGCTLIYRARYSRGQLGHEVRTRITKQNILISVVNDSSDSDLIFLVK